MVGKHRISWIHEDEKGKARGYTTSEESLYQCGMQCNVDPSGNAISTSSSLSIRTQCGVDTDSDFLPEFRLYS